jgi:hypothetical protein
MTEELGAYVAALIVARLNGISRDWSFGAEKTARLLVAIDEPSQQVFHLAMPARLFAADGRTRDDAIK